MAKVIWYLHHYAGAPSIGMSYRPFYLAREWQLAGEKPYIIAAHFHHSLDRKTMQKEAIRLEKIAEVPYLWLKVPTYQGNGIKRIYNMFAYAAKIALHAKKLVAITGKPEAIIVSSAHPLHYLTAHWVAKKYQAKLIFEVRDIWPLSLVEILQVSPKHPLVKLLAWIEKKAYRQADYVVSLLPEALAHMQAHGLEANRFRYIPNGTTVMPPLKTVPLTTTLSQHIAELKAQKKFIVAYLGAHGAPNALEQLIQAMVLLQAQNAQVHAVLVGKGELKATLKKMANNLNNISFFDPIEKDSVPEFLSLVDAAFLGWKALPIYRFGISANKLFDYMLAAKPIIHAAEVGGDPVQAAGCGMVVPPENPPLLAAALLKMAQMPPESLAAAGKKGKAYVLAHHDYQVLAQKYSTLF